MRPHATMRVLCLLVYCLVAHARADTPPQGLAQSAVEVAIKTETMADGTKMFTVGDGSTGSCDEDGLHNALQKAQSASGAHIELDCGPPGELAEIILKSQLRIETQGAYVIRAKCGAAWVTLDGGGTNRLLVLGKDDKRGVRAEESSLTLKDLTLRNGFGQTIDMANRIVQDGGCLYIGTMGDLFLENVEMTDCKVGPEGKGGAIAHNTHQVGGSTTVTRGTVSIKNSYFARNSAGTAGGMLWCGKCNAVIEGSKFVHNVQYHVPTYHGGPIPAWPATTFLGAPPVAVGGVAHFYVSPSVSIKNCEFIENESQGDGGALDFRRSNHVQIEASLFRGNKALGNKVPSFPTGGSKYGKGFCWCGGGAIKLSQRTNAIMKHCTFIENHAKQGGAVRLVWTSLEAEDNVFARNVAVAMGNETDGATMWDIGGNGGAVLHDFLHNGASWKGCRFENNTAHYRGGGYNAFSGKGEKMEMEGVHFCGNRVSPYNKVGGGMNMGGDGKLVMKHSMFGGNEVPANKKTDVQNLMPAKKAKLKKVKITDEICDFVCPVGAGGRCAEGFHVSKTVGLPSASCDSKAESSTTVAPTTATTATTTITTATTIDDFATTTGPALTWQLKCQDKVSAAKCLDLAAKSNKPVKMLCASTSSKNHFGYKCAAWCCQHSDGFCCSQCSNSGDGDKCVKIYPDS